MNKKVDAILGFILPIFNSQALRPKTWIVGYLSDRGLSVEYIASVTGMDEEAVRKERLRAKEEKSRPHSLWDHLREK